VSATSPAIAARRSSFLAVAATVIFGLLMAVMDQAIVNVAIPSIGGTLGASSDEAAWVATGYVLGMMIVMPLNGWLTSRFGEKRYYLGAFGIFTLASFLCGLCPSIGLLITARILQGLGGGALQPIALAILLRSSPREQHANMVAAFAFASTVPFALGPIVGGYLLDNYDLSFPVWPMLFFFKIPLCVAGLVVAYFVLEDDPPQAFPAPMDWSSVAALALMLAALQMVLSGGQRQYWFESHEIVALTVLMVAAFGYFIYAQVRAARPLVNLRVFRTLSFTVGCILSIVSGFGLYGINLVTPLFFQGPLHLTPYQSGLFLLQGTIATSIVMPFIGPLTRRIDARYVLGIALLMFAAGAWAMGSLDADAGYWDIFVPRIAQGLALGLLFVPLIAITLSQVPPDLLSDAAGIATLVRYLGGNIGIALLQVLQVNRANEAISAMAGTVTLGHTSIARIVSVAGLAHARAFLSGVVLSNASLVSYLYLFRVSGVLFALTIPLLLLLPDPRGTRAPKGDTVAELTNELETVPEGSS
jgi:DHA2 family multidrug resistance protein